MKKQTLKELRELYEQKPTAELEKEIQSRQRAHLFRALVRLAENNGKNQFEVAAELADRFVLENVMTEDEYYFIPYGVLKPCWSSLGIGRCVDFD